MIFIKKNIDKLVHDQFLQPVKDHPYDKFGYVEKIMPLDLNLLQQVAYRRNFYLHFQILQNDH